MEEKCECTNKKDEEESHNKNCKVKLVMRVSGTYYRTKLVVRCRYIPNKLHKIRKLEIK